MDQLEGSTLSYFPMPGRAEAIRLVFSILGVNFEDNRVEFKDWPALKPSAPYGNMPYLKLKDGTFLSQSVAILRLAGTLGGMYPKDPFQAAKIDELFYVTEDLFQKLNKTGQGQEKEAKEAARLEFVSKGEGASYLAKFEQFIKDNGKDGHVVGDSLSIADIHTFCYLNFMTTGFFDGVPTTLLDGYPLLQASRKFVGSHPKVVEWYSRPGERTDMEKHYQSAKDLQL